MHRDILRIEFDRRDPESLPDEDGRITEWAFADMLLQHSGLSEKKQAKMLRRVRKFYKHMENRPVRLFQVTLLRAQGRFRGKVIIT